MLLQLCGLEVLNFHFYDIRDCSMSRCVRAIIKVASFTSFPSINMLFVIPAVRKLQAVVLAFQQF